MDAAAGFSRRHGQARATGSSYPVMFDAVLRCAAKARSIMGGVNGVNVAFLTCLREGAD
jgi:hypothetical protein